MPLAVSDALRDVDWFLSSFDVLVEDGPEVTRTLAALCREVQVAGRQVHDANIVATMLTHAEGRLLTFNPDDFRRYGDRIALIDPAAGVWASGCAFRRSGAQSTYRLPDRRARAAPAGPY